MVRLTIFTMKQGDVLFCAVYSNHEYTSNADWSCTNKDSQAWFYIKQTCIVSYSYGDHCDFNIIDRTGLPAILSIGNFDVLKFYTGGTRENFFLAVEFKDRRLGHLHIHHIAKWQDPIKDTLDFVKQVADCGSYDIYLLRQENKALRAEIEQLKNS